MQSSESSLVEITTNRPKYKNPPGFYAKDKTFNYFPRGLQKYFDNLELIVISNGHVKEIHQTDLKPFSELKLLLLPNNQIEIIEENLFEFNRKLVKISFYSNCIFYVHPKVFVNLQSLNSIDMKFNACVNDKIENSKNITMFMKSNCASSECTNFCKFYYFFFNNSMLRQEQNDTKTDADGVTIKGHDNNFGQMIYENNFTNTQRKNLH